jgi:putative N-acetyltransferase (TIGR04045 family)
MRSELSLAAGSEPAPPPRDEKSHRARATVVCRPVVSAADRAAHFAIRHRIFVEEQRVFPESDLDAHDCDESVIALLGQCDDVPAGTVRLFVLDPPDGLWQGDRLAVLAPYRTRGVGAPLVSCAVATAAALGGRRMAAHIQPANVTFFERLGWVRSGVTEIYAGLAHQPMSIELPGRDEAVATLRALEAGISARDLSRR